MALTVLGNLRASVRVPSPNMPPGYIRLALAVKLLEGNAPLILLVEVPSVDTACLKKGSHSCLPSLLKSVLLGLHFGILVQVVSRLLRILYASQSTFVLPADLPVLCLIFVLGRIRGLSDLSCTDLVTDRFRSSGKGLICCPKDSLPSLLRRIEDLAASVRSMVDLQLYPASRSLS